jgi:hypothetical protein
MVRHRARSSSRANRVNVIIEYLVHQRYPIEQGHRPQIGVQVTMQQDTQCLSTVV